MAVIDSLQEIFFNLRKNKLRSVLTAFGVFWGIFLLILLLGAGQGLANGAQSNFSAIGKNAVFVWSRKTSLPYKGLESGRNIRLDMSDVEALRREIPELKYLSAEQRYWGNTVMTHKEVSINSTVFGIADSFFNIKSGIDFPRGRTLNYLDGEASRKVALLGKPVADSLFPNSDALGRFFKINNVSFRVIGIFDDSSNNGRDANRVYLPFSIFNKTFGRGTDGVSGIAYIPVDNVDIDALQTRVINSLKKRHRVAPKDKAAILFFSVAEQKKRFDALFSGINGFIWFVGIGTLTAGIVGISNIMLITVKERTVEIGIRKALGARPINIISSLLFESVLITTIAGYFGLVAGVGLIELVTFAMQSLNIKSEFFNRPEVNFLVAIQAIVILVVVGALAGLVPAWRAAKISPVEAMRST